MNTAKFNTMLAALEHLTDQQIRRVERVLKGESPEKQVIHAIQQRITIGNGRKARMPLLPWRPN